MHDLVTIVTLILPFVFVIAILWIQGNEKHKRRQLQADLYFKALEKGQPVPVDLFADEKKQNKPLNIGIILISVGIGIMVCLGLLFHFMVEALADPGLSFLPTLAFVGLLPFMVGVAFVIIHFIEKKKDTGENAK